MTHICILIMNVNLIKRCVCMNEKSKMKKNERTTRVGVVFSIFFFIYI